MNMSPRASDEAAEAIRPVPLLGASYKEVADYFHVSWSTVDNTLRNYEKPVRIEQGNQVGAWWFCANFGISFDLSLSPGGTITSLLLCLFLSGEAAFSSDKVYAVRRVRRARTNIVQEDKRPLRINPIFFNQKRIKGVRR